jgi:hypothetical protein
MGDSRRRVVDNPIHRYGVDGTLRVSSNYRFPSTERESYARAKEGVDARDKNKHSYCVLLP